MLFSTNQGNIKPQILFNNEDVEFVENHKHLGVTFSSNCKWHCHIQNILKNTSGKLSMLRKLCPPPHFCGETYYFCPVRLSVCPSVCHTVCQRNSSETTEQNLMKHGR